MISRIEVETKVADTRARVRKKKFTGLGDSPQITDLFIRDVYTIDKDFSQKELQAISSMLTNPVTQNYAIYSHPIKKFDTFDGAPSMNLGEHAPLSINPEQSRRIDWAIEVGYLPGVTDNIANTAREIIEDLLKTKFKDGEGIYTSQITYFAGKISRSDTQLIAESMFNPIIQRVHIKSYKEYKKAGGMDFIIPKVRLSEKPKISEVSLNVSDDELVKIGKSGIANSDGSRRGPLALDIAFMKTIQKYFKKLGRNPTDIELESLAQTWSEHCKHTIFADPIDEVKDGLFKHYIQRATEEIRVKKGGHDFCVSVFKDNSGAISFDNNYLITHKVETHNSPSALDPFGGAITGIVGVNRDTIGFGLGAKPIANSYGFCLADPRVDTPLYKGPNRTQKMLSSRRIMEGVIEGVNAGGNQSGIPTPSGFIYFDERYRGKPLVFVGTVGLIPRKIRGKPSYIKKAKKGDYIVMIGGRVGKDGIHGATFSSEAMDTGSPVTAVQIGDPITQKKLSDVIVKEARNKLLYHSITDNGAGGLSCSVAEMAKESGGCIVDLSKVPLKYPGLEPWEIWVSESQERMTLAVPPRNWQKFVNLMERRGVEATIIGRFTNSGKCVVKYEGEIIVDIGMQFLHYGLPKRPMTTIYTPSVNKEPLIPKVKDFTKPLLSMLSRLNIAGYEFISQQYDYIVQGNLSLPPLQGRGRINADASVIKPVLNSSKGLIMSQGIYPSYSDIDTYHMVAACIDTAIRNVVAAGGNLEKIALLDNFCWCSSNDSFRLGQLKRAVRACYDYATYYQTPFISGKDSMFNDFKGFDSDGKPIKISILPTLLITSIGVVDEITKVVSLDLKFPDDLIYILGKTDDELGASEYYAMVSESLNKKYIGNSVPKVDAERNKRLYQALNIAI
ncbi:MAG: hypothetical protein ACD_24C00295G0002, partial [uncultured bacterium]